MATNLAGRRYRTWYAMLLRLYPRPFRERFGEGMAQTFHDLCREHRDARRGLFGLALWIFFETSVGIVRENTTHMSQLGKTMLRVALGALAVLMVPLVASQLVKGWNWSAGSFVFVYVLFFGTGMVYAVIARKMGAWSYKAGVGVALVAGFALVWSNMVHVADSENPANWCTTACSRWGLAGAAGGARVGSHVVRDGGDACADCRDAAFGRAALPCAEYGHPAWCLRGVVHRVRSAVPAREFGGIEVRPRPITNRPPVRRAPGLIWCI
jgi:uncharacterized membrane protein YgdD (TMEM256/DUF423 family)